jgi:uncharacterized protein with PIN domain
VIEQGAHEVGIRLSRLIQQQRTREVVAEAGGKARCPGCQKLCEVVSKARTIQSVDGKVKILEAKARCSHCQRDFFPSADAFGD